jgi:hypothetical protein
LRNNQQNLIYFGVVLLTLLLAAGLTWANFQLASHANVEDAFAPVWAGARIVITDQANPYNSQTLAQYMPSGNPVGARFVYPFYGMLAFLPFGLIEAYPLAKALWTSLMMVSLLVVVFTSLSLTTWRPAGRILAMFMLFSLFGYSAIRGVYQGNTGLLVAMLVALGLQAVLKGRNRAAGILLGLTIIKPTMVALLLPSVFLYAVSKRNFRLLRSMLLTVSILIAGAFLAFPSWFYQNFAQVVYLFNESYPSSISAVISSLFGENIIMTALAGVFGLWLVIEWWRSLGKDVRWFLWTAALTLVLTEFIGIPTNTSNYVILLIPLTLTFSTIEQRWKTAGPGLVVALMVIILLASWLPFYLIAGSDLAQSEPLLMFFPLPLLSLGMLYWVRYWALSSIKLRVERLEALRKL